MTSNLLFAAALAAVLAGAALAQGVTVSSPAGTELKTSPPTTAGPAVDGTVDKLAWLSGCWQAKSDKDGSTFREVWLAPVGGTMLGVGHNLRDEKTAGWEAMRLYNDGKSVKAWLHPGARKEFTMTMEEFEDGFASFAITEGDTTTRLSYQRRGAEELSVSFRLIKGEDRRGIDFAFKRTDCAVWTTVQK